MDNPEVLTTAPGKKSISLRTRILLTVYVLTALIFLLCSWRILSLSYNLVIENTFDLAISEHRDFGESLKKYIENLSFDKNNFYINEDIHNAIRKHTANSGREGRVFQIRESGGTLISSNMTSEEASAVDFLPSPGISTLYSLKRLGDRHVVFVSSHISLYGFMYRLDYIKDVTASVDSLISLSRRVSVSVFISILLLPLALFFVIRKALAPLMRLGAQAREIAKGNYNLRVNIAHNDEVGMLAGDFNNMVDRLQNHIDMLSETVRLRELFAANLAHELKTPLTSIIGYSDIAGRTNPEKEKLAKIHNYIKNEGKRLDLLSEKLLSWSRIAQTNEIDIRECNSRQIIEHLAGVKILPEIMVLICRSQQFNGFIQSRNR